MCRIKAKVFDRKAGIELPEFSKGDDAGNTVMTFCIKETDMKGDIGLIAFIMAGQHVEGMAKIIRAEVTVPSPGCVRVREMAGTRAVGDTIVSTVTDSVSVRAGMGMDAGAIAGNGKAVRRDQTKFQGRDDGGNGKQPLKGLFIVEREIPVLQGIVSNLFCDTGMAVRQFPAFAGLGRRLFILISREKVITAQLFKARAAEPEAVDKVKIRPERREMARGAADQHGKEIIRLKLCDPVGKAGKLAVKHKDKGAQDLGLIDGGSASI